MAYFSTNAICFKKKKKVHIWAWIKLIINTFNVTLGLCWSACPSQPAQGCTTFPAALPAAKHNLLCPEGKRGPQLWWAAAPLPSCCHTWLEFSTRETTVASQTPSRDPQSASAYFRSHLRKRSSSASTSLSNRERSVETRGSWWLCSKATPWAHLLWSESKGSGYKAQLF